MEKLDLSTNSKSIHELYSKVVRGDSSVSYGVFTVNSNNVLDATSSGSGDLNDFVAEFSDGIVQFGLARVTAPGSDVYKYILLGWCPDNAPSKLRLAFAPSFVEVSKVFSGYHIQITARDIDDLDVSDMISRVSAAAGAGYTNDNSSMRRPPTALGHMTHKPERKPANSKIVSPSSEISNNPTTRLPPVVTRKADLTSLNLSDDDGWGDEKPIEERDLDKHPLEDVPSAYVPTSVNLKELKTKSPVVLSPPSRSVPALKTKAVQNEQPFPIASRTQASLDGEIKIPRSGNKFSVSTSHVMSDHAPTKTPNFGSKPLAPVAAHSREKKGNLFQNHANENGLSPAQAWAMKRGKYVVNAKNDEKNIEESVANLSISPIESGEDARIGLQVTEEKPPRGEEGIENTPQASSSVQPSTKYTRSEDSSEQTSAIKASSIHEGADDQDDSRIHASSVDPDVSKIEQKVVSAVAVYDYEKDEDNEISFKEGDEIVSIDFIDEEWWFGRNVRTGEAGLFPGSYVTVENPPDRSEKNEDAPTAPAAVAVDPASTSKRKTAVAEYDYEKEEDNELAFEEGDTIVDIEFVDDDWWSGRNSRSGEVGLFPGNFVVLQ